MAGDSQANAHTLQVFAIKSPSWGEDIQTYLSEKGYQLSTITQDDLKSLAKSENVPDAILILTQTEDLDVFRIIEDQDNDSIRPLLVLIMGDVESNLPYEWADLVLPPQTKYIDYQLKTVLRLRHENSSLKNDTTTLTNQLEELKRTSEEQQRSLKEIEILKNAIVRNVSHELKTPLLQVKSAVSLLAEDAKDEELVEYARNATARLETLVKNITLLGSSLDIHPGPVIVRDALEYARRNLGRIWEYRNDIGRVEINLEDGLPPVEADKQGLNTILQLLMDNALKFSKETVEVSAKRSNKHIEFSVKDAGIGIAKDQLDKIFEIFYQVDASSTRRYGGTGVGLAIVRLILDRHDMSIMVDSQQGQGSTFKFKLPAVEL